MPLVFVLRHLTIINAILHYWSSVGAQKACFNQPYHFSFVSLKPASHGVVAQCTVLNGFVQHNSFQCRISSLPVAIGISWHYKKYWFFSGLRDHKKDSQRTTKHSTTRPKSSLLNVLFIVTTYDLLTRCLQIWNCDAPVHDPTQIALLLTVCGNWQHTIMGNCFRWNVWLPLLPVLVLLQSKLRQMVGLHQQNHFITYHQVLRF